MGDPISAGNLDREGWGNPIPTGSQMWDPISAESLEGGGGDPIYAENLHRGIPYLQEARFGIPYLQEPWGGSHICRKPRCV